jgi:hypothetical protein
MTNDRLEKYAALTGLGAVVLIIVGFVIVTPTPPSTDAAATEYGAYFTDHKDAIRAGLAILAISMLFYVWFLGSLSSALRSAIGSPRLPSVAFAGGIVSASFFVLALTATATAAFRPEETSPEVLRLLSDFALMSGMAATGGFVALFAATALVIARTSALPDWLCWVCALGAVCSLGGLGVPFTATGAFAGDGAIGLYLPFLGFIVPITALSVVLYQRVGSGGLVDRVAEAVGRVAR